MSIQGKTKLCRDHHLLPNRSQPFANNFFINEWAVHLSCIEKSNAPFDRSPHHGNHFLFGARHRPVAFTHPHAAEADGGYFEIALAQFSLLHFFSVSRVCDRQSMPDELRCVLQVMCPDRLGPVLVHL